MNTARSRAAALVGIAAAAILALTACSTSSAETPVSSGAPSASTVEVSTPFEGESLTLATDANYPPCQFFEEGSDVMIGYEVDLWDAIAAKLGVSLQVENTQFASLIPGVQSGRYDIAMECISDNPEREEQVSFVNYIFDKTDVVTIESYDGPITEGDDLSLCGETMGAQTGFDTIDKVNDILNPACEEAGLEPVVIQEYPNAADTYNALNSARVDFMILGTSAAAYLNQTAPTPINYTGIESFPQKYLGMVIAKDNTELQEALLAGLEAVIADGTYLEILEKWGMESLALEEPGINLATTRPLD
ncbi:ABC transporter substrate-binding protein [uncultured Microbacterium sp.]|uniref:Extracellular solute-binding protein family 3 n=1 Tax=uncultured Microbacterium sp. TaxID=191216 RepID=A0A1Y5P739_9MICO|nr:ABC transporter substrate-binding protein [uncultured Microbacterium sp.]SBS71748.1 Extracellular solute-binding protein family 3 [uncultured Microbacterium sp.]